MSTEKKKDKALVVVVVHVNYESRLDYVYVDSYLETLGKFLELE